MSSTSISDVSLFRPPAPLIKHHPFSTDTYHDRQIANGPFFQSVSPSPSPFPSSAAPQTRTLIDLQQDWLHLLRLGPLRVPCRAPVFRACISYCIFNESFNCASSTSSLSSSEASEAPDSFDAAVCTPQMILLVSGAFLTSRDAALAFLLAVPAAFLPAPVFALFAASLSRQHLNNRYLG